MHATVTWERLALLLHAILGASVVAVATHHAVWACRLTRGARHLRRGERRFVALLAILYLAQLALGNLLYPRYRVEVRAEYLDDPAVAIDEASLRLDARHAIEGPAAIAGPERPLVLGGVAHLFDIKEQLLALGLAPLLGLLVLSREVDPAAEPDARPLYLGLSITLALFVWTGALIGLFVTSVRSVGG